VIARVLLLLLCAATAFAQTAPDAVIYMERPEGGPMATTGRELPSSGGVKIYGIDVNSSVDVNVDSTELAAALAAAGVGTTTPEQKALLARITNLQQVINDIIAAVQEDKQVMELFHTGSVEDFKAHRRSVSGKVRQIRDRLVVLISDRLVSTGVAEQDARTRAQNTIGLLGLNLQTDWPRLRQLVANEIAATSAAYNATEPQLGVALEIQAHLVPKTGDPFAIPLPGYNTVEPGPLSRYEKIKFEIPSEQRALFDQYQALALKTGEAKNAGAAFLLALRSDFALSPIKMQLDKIQADANSIKGVINAIDTKTLQTWLTSASKNAVQSNPADQQVLNDVTELVNDAKTGQSLFTELTNLGKLADTVKATADPVSALELVLNQLSSTTAQIDQLSKVGSEWKTFIADAEKAKSSLTAAGVTAALKTALVAPDSPFAPLLGSQGDLAVIQEDVNRLAEMLTSFRESETAAISVSNLPVPQGQQRRPIESNIGTAFNLQTVPGTRSPGDNVRLGYTFYRGDEKLSDPTWTDVFEVRVYGLQDKALASLAFIRRMSEEKFKPTAAMSWLLSVNPWPKTADSPRKSLKLLSGVGLSTMSLEFDEAETVELGVAPTISFLNDVLLIGYGWNLQADKDRTYAFFSFRLLSRPGFLNN
jgi:hypothetical protein